MPAQADIYTFTVDACGGGCGPISTGTVTVTQDTPINGIDTVRIDVEFNPSSGYGFVATGAGKGDSFFFDILNEPAITVSFDKNGINTTGWSLDPNVGNLPGSNGSLSGFDYGLYCAGAACASSGGGTTAPPPLIFDVSAAGLTPASFDVLDGHNDAYFAADVLSTVTGKTGMIGATLTSQDPPSAVPEPGSIILFGTILAGIVTGARKGRSRTSKQLV